MFILKNNRNRLTIQDNMRCVINVCVKTDQFRFSRVKVNLVSIRKFFTSGDYTSQTLWGWGNQHESLVIGVCILLSLFILLLCCIYVNFG